MQRGMPCQGHLQCRRALNLRGKLPVELHHVALPVARRVVRDALALERVAPIDDGPRRRARPTAKLRVGVAATVEVDGRARTAVSSIAKSVACAGVAAWHTWASQHGMKPHLDAPYIRTSRRRDSSHHCIRFGGCWTLRESSEKEAAHGLVGLSLPDVSARAMLPQISLRTREVRTGSSAIRHPLSGISHHPLSGISHQSK